MVRSADPTRPDFDHSLSSGPFAAQLALARVHPALAPMCDVRDGYRLDLSLAAGWHALPSGRGLAGYGLARALRLLLDLLAGLTALHDTQTESGEGFVHGELVPAFVRVDAQGGARLMPLAPWHWQAPEAPLSRESRGHLAPERLLGDTIDRRADVFSAGVLLWEALAGRRLFEHDSVDEIITRLMGGKVQLPELPPELAWAIPLKAVTMRALSVDPEQRFQGCPEFAAAIEAVARGHVASHAQVAAHFAAPPRPLPSLPPPLPRAAAREPGFNASHKSSLSALVAPTLSVTPASGALDLESRAAPARKRRVGWTMTALVCLFVALGMVAFTRHTQAPAAAHEAPQGAPLAPPAPAAAVVPGKANAPAQSNSALVPKLAPVAPESTARPTHQSPPARDNKLRAAPKPSRPAGAPAKAPRMRDYEAEQYGI